jgi:hypothetical protein
MKLEGQIKWKGKEVGTAMKELENNIRPLRIGSAAVREAGLCPAVAATQQLGLCPGFGLCPQGRHHE